MSQTQDPEVFKERWEEHISDFSRLWHTLPEEEIERLQDAQDELRELVEIAAKELDD